MTDRADPLVHIGFPKTATTFLQRQVFGVDPEIRPLGRPDPGYDADDNGLRYHLLRADTATFDARIPVLRTLTARAGAGARARQPVLSDEHMATGRLTSPVATQTAATILDRVHALWPTAHVLIVVRRQSALLRAVHRNELRMARTRMGPDAWLDSLKRDSARAVLHAFDFEALIATASTIFGPDRVHVALYEDMAHRPEHFAQTLGAAVGIPSDRCREHLRMPTVNATSAAEDLYLAVRRRVPGALRRSAILRPLRRVVSLQRVHAMGSRWLPTAAPKAGFSARNEQFLNDFFAASNTALAERLGRDLGALGYPTEPCQRVGRTTVRPEHGGPHA